MPASIAEIAPDVFRLSIYNPDFDLQFNHFLVRDEEPLLYHAGMRRMFPELKEAVASLIDPAALRWISFSHFEVDECGALNDWLALAPNATAAAGTIGTLVNLGDYAIRPARGMQAGEVLETGRYRFQYQPTPHLPHGWDAGVLFEETQRTLFCSDLFHHAGECEPVAGADILERTADTIHSMQLGPLMDYMPWTPKTEQLLEQLATLEPRTLAIMHGSSLVGDGAAALRKLGPIFKEVFGEAPVAAR